MNQHPRNQFSAASIQYCISFDNFRLFVSVNEIVWLSNDADGEEFMKRKTKKRLKNEFKYRITESETLSCHAKVV